MDQLSPLIPIEQYAFIKTFSLYILSYHLHPCFLRSPLALLTCPNLICSTRRTSASVGLCRIWPNHRMQFSLIFSSIGAMPILVRISSFLTLSLIVLSHIQWYTYLSTNILISHLISPRITTHPMKNAHLHYTHLLGMISLYSPTFCAI